MTANTNKGYVPTFTSSASALRTLRTGKNNPNWRAAAEYLMERAAPDVKLLVEAATQIEIEKGGLRTERREVKSAKQGFKLNLNLDLKPSQWILLLAGSAAFIALILWILSKATLRVC